ncbi:MAG TPA: hypothetical protein VFP84_22955 [Kofleriaceae bacterium]|nr:hypothetical protein [Kofleriaceae bacterium]
MGTGSSVKKGKEISSWHVGVAAEAIAAGLFARCNLDVSVQYGANQPEYDLIIAKGDKLLKVSVKGSQDGGWGLTQSYMKNGDYLGAIDLWHATHKPKTIYCFVQFQGVLLDEMPRVYVATPVEVANRLRATCAGGGSTILYEKHAWTLRAKPQYANTIEEIPPTWKFTKQRVESLFDDAA